MSICDDCEFRNYSPELCKMHLKHLASVNSNSSAISKFQRKIKEILPNKKLAEAAVSKKEIIDVENEKVVKSVFYGGTCVLASTLAVAAAPVLGFHAVAHAMAVKISAGVVGGSIPFFKTKNKTEQNRTEQNRRR
ncbi:MAG: hypothetical protein HQK49_04790 [Oligoflexia bacterium]|nr:hypothetical protein [Oligoflexia bacterium]